MRSCVFIDSNIAPRECLRLVATEFRCPSKWHQATSMGEEPRSLQDPVQIEMMEVGMEDLHTVRLVHT